MKLHVPWEEGEEGIFFVANKITCEEATKGRGSIVNYRKMPFGKGTFENRRKYFVHS